MNFVIKNKGKVIRIINANKMIVNRVGFVEFVGNNQKYSMCSGTWDFIETINEDEIEKQFPEIVDITKNE